MSAIASSGQGGPSGDQASAPWTDNESELSRGCRHAPRRSLPRRMPWRAPRDPRSPRTPGAAFRVPATRAMPGKPRSKAQAAASVASAHERGTVKCPREGRERSRRTGPRRRGAPSPARGASRASAPKHRGERHQHQDRGPRHVLRGRIQQGGAQRLGVHDHAGGARAARFPPGEVSPARRPGPRRLAVSPVITIRPAKELFEQAARPGLEHPLERHG